MKRKMILCLSAILMFFLIGCEDGSTNGIDGTEDREAFELTGSWAGTGTMNIDTDGDSVPDTPADLAISVTFNAINIETDVLNIISIGGTQVHQSTTKIMIVDFSNTENWYITKIIDAEEASIIGKYARTEYVLSADNSSFTGTDYAYKDTVIEAKLTQDTQPSHNAVMIRQ